jgi:hypothetical protein
MKYVAIILEPAKKVVGTFYTKAEAELALAKAAVNIGNLKAEVIPTEESALFPKLETEAVKPEAPKLRYSVPPKPGKGKVCGETPLLWYAPRNEVAFDGKLQIIERPEAGAHKGYKGAVLENPTWGKLFAEAKKVARITGDQSHVFFEGFYVLGAGDGFSVARLSMGS